MKQWIRWSGLTGFLLLTALIVSFFMLLAGPLIKSAIEHFGSQAAGAEVSIADVSISMNPLGVILTDLQVADADQPMENLLQFDQAVAQLELAPLLLGKGIVRDLSVENLQFNRARQTSGALTAQPLSDSEQQSADQQSAANEAAQQSSGGKESALSDSVGARLPDVDDILAREPLKTEQAGTAVQQAFDEHQQAIHESMAAVPDADALASYEKQLKALLSTDIRSLDEFKQRKQSLDALKQTFASDKKAVAQARRVIRQARADLAEKLSTLKAAPSEDLATIKSKYQLDSRGAANLSALLFGAEAGEWAEKALYWYEKVKPYLASEDSDAASTDSATTAQRAQGRFIHFPSDDPWPEFLIRRSRMTAPIAGGQLSIEASDITHQQAVLGRPTQVVVQGQQLTNIEDLNLEATLDHRQSPAKDSMTLNIKDWHVQEANLGGADTRLTSAMVQVQGLAIVSAGRLQAKADAQVSQTQFASSGKTQFARELQGALTGINRFDINASASGDIASPKVKLGSDLDKKLNVAFQQRLKQKQQQLEQKLTERLNAKVQSYLGGSAADINRLNQLDGSLSDKGAQLETMAASQLDDFEAQQKARAKAKEEEARRKLEAEKRKAEEQAKQRQRELEQKAKDKVKNLF